MSRKYTNSSQNSVKIQTLLNTIAAPQEGTPINAYREAMFEIGQCLGKDIARYKDEGVEHIYLACTVEDADFLAKGILSELEALSVFKSVNLACFWNERVEYANGVNAAPILKKYKEPSQSSDKQMLIVLKSIISGACVVRTNLTNLIEEMSPDRIVIAAPVMYVDAEANLAMEFSPEISSSFEYLTYAIDDELDGSNVVPGIGGNVYTRLGFGDQEGKNKIIPQLVKDRRKQQTENSLTAHC